MNNDIENSIINVVNEARFTANQLAVINAFYNSQNAGITIIELANRIGKIRNGQIGGILSKLAQKIDKLEQPFLKFGFSGYRLFFDLNNDDLLIIRPEFRKVIDHNPKLKPVMEMNLIQIYKKFQNGL
ncbi:MAG: hypothetical protein CVU46_11640 [Chloroflexi bacterium HGW-Chloroflexi-8]|nr:MAG: hypothetical protein CVU46_11640 [Chloroflexi bacterium HGW-Chloroflexi-8]